MFCWANPKKFDYKYGYGKTFVFLRKPWILKFLLVKDRFHSDAQAIVAKLLHKTRLFFLDIIPLAGGASFLGKIIGILCLIEQNYLTLSIEGNIFL